MSLARNSTAFSNRSFNARTTGAPLLDIILARSEQSLARLRYRASIIAKPLIEDGRDVLERGNLDHDRAAKHDFSGPDGGEIAGVGNRECQPPIGTPMWENRHRAQKAMRERLHQWRGGDKLGQRHARQLEKSGDLVGKITGRKLRQLPQLAQRPICLRG
jgi:hypothetical protein